MDPPQDAAPPAGGGTHPVRGWRDDLRLVARRDVGLLVGSRLVSDLGTGVAPIALAFGVLALPGGDASSLGLVLLASVLPRLLFTLLGGVLADRVNRAHLMVVAESMAGLAQALAGLLFLTGRASVPALAALAVVNGTAVALFYPSMTGLVPQLVADEELQSTNAFIRLSSNVSMILGTALGGILVATVGAGWALMLDALTFAVSAGLLAAVHVPGHVVSAAAASMLDDLVHGWREFTSRRWVWFVVILFGFSNMGFTAGVAVLGPVQSLQSWDGARAWAFVLASFSLGTVVGVLVAVRVRPSRPLRVAMTAQLFVAVPLFALAPPLPLVVVTLLAFVSGVCVDVFEVLWATALQQNVPGESLSRVTSYDWLGSLALTPVALAGAGALVAVIGLQRSILVCAILGSATLFGLIDPQVRNLRAGRPEAAPRDVAPQA